MCLEGALASRREIDTSRFKGRQAEVSTTMAVDGNADMSVPRHRFLFSDTTPRVVFQLLGRSREHKAFDRDRNLCTIYDSNTHTRRR